MTTFEKFLLQALLSIAFSLSGDKSSGSLVAKDLRNKFNEWNKGMK